MCLCLRVFDGYSPLDYSSQRQRVKANGRRNSVWLLWWCLTAFHSGLPLGEVAACDVGGRSTRVWFLCLIAVRLLPPPCH